MQNDQLNLTVILAEKNCKIMHYSRRYLYFFGHFSSFILKIWLPTKHYFAIFFSKNDCKIEQVVLHSINPQNSTKDRFSQRKSLKFFFHKCQMNWEYVELCARLKKKKTRLISTVSKPIKVVIVVVIMLFSSKKRLAQKNLSQKLLDSKTLLIQKDFKVQKYVLSKQRPYQILSLCRKDEILKIGLVIKGKHLVQAKKSQRFLK